MAKKHKSPAPAPVPHRFGAPAAAQQPPELLRLAIAGLQQGQVAAAQGLLRSILAADPRNFDALHLLGLTAIKQGDFAQAVTHLRQAAAVNDAFAPLHNNLGIALREAGNPDGALAAYDKALALQPGYADALSNRGNALRDLGRNVEALACYDQALALNGQNAAAWNNRGRALEALGRPQEALASYDRALVLQPGYAPAWINRGAALEDLNRPADALASYDRAIALQPANAEAINNRGSALEALSRHQEALDCYDRALALDPGKVEVLANRGHALAFLGRHTEAAAAFSLLVEQRPMHPYGLGDRFFSRQQVCDWRDHAAQVGAIEAAVAKGQRVCMPFALLAVTADASIQKMGAELFAADRHPPVPLPSALVEPVGEPQGQRVRLAYLSADFHDHATAHLMAGLFERHDRSKFETWAFSFGPDRASPMRERLKAAFDHFVAAEQLSDAEVAQQLRDRGIDIAVDLKGYTRDSRPGILAFRPAPVQVSYLGYPGTMGSPAIDYLIADRVVIPPGSDVHYTESVVRLPGTYQVNSRLPVPVDQMPDRAQLGLPQAGFVFCCFSSSYKITPPVFDVWMRLLDRVAGSVLWLLEDNPDCSANLRREAAARGVAPERLVFAPRARLPEHIARHRLADLFLDTLPVNAHTTASDALWAGLPLLTATGQSFASRVAASLLLALGLPELVTADLASYERAALELATQPERLQALRSRLAFEGEVHPLADVDRYRIPLETAYVTMLDRARQGLAPQAFEIAQDL